MGVVHGKGQPIWQLRRGRKPLGVKVDFSYAAVSGGEVRDDHRGGETRVGVDRLSATGAVKVPFDAFQHLGDANWSGQREQGAERVMIAAASRPDASVSLDGDQPGRRRSRVMFLRARSWPPSGLLIWVLGVDYGCRHAYILEVVART